MARMVECNATGELGTSDNFVKIKGRYYKNEEEYEKVCLEKKNRANIFLKFGELLGYEADAPPLQVNGLIGKKLKDCNFTINEFYKILLEKEGYLKEFFKEHKSKNTINQILSIFTIIKNTQSITYGGCYEIKNLDTNEIYIGETIDIFSRLNTHISELYSNTHHCSKLQNAFNQSHDISRFKFSPLFLYEIKNIDREKEKHKTLYLETAYYLKFKHEKKVLYNTIDTYNALKNNTIVLKDYNIDCNKVLEMLLTDEYDILPLKLKEAIKKNTTIQ